MHKTCTKVYAYIYIYMCKYFYHIHTHTHTHIYIYTYDVRICGDTAVMHWWRFTIEEAPSEKTWQLLQDMSLVGTPLKMLGHCVCLCGNTFAIGTSQGNAVEHKEK